MKKSVFLINGPNLNLLGKRDHNLYGSATLNDIILKLREIADKNNVELSCLQSNIEGELINFIHQAIDTAQAIIINPGAYSHTSIAIRDALECFKGKIIEVHLSNIHKREEFRHKSYVSEVASGVICGLGAVGYELALQTIINEK
ncbi:MAG: type II 3-dehydroquinate dehydratase [Proteobacteria bacterium]|nr:type II 3-dehydroquinate dehydratase [Pseudomonadota bacterium]